MRKRRKKISTSQKYFNLFVLILLIGFVIYYKDDIKIYLTDYFNPQSEIKNISTLTDIPPYEGSMYVTINNNSPSFTKKDYQTSAFESYSNLDYLNRAGVAFANINSELMPKKREPLYIKPSGWHTIKYDIVSGKYLYNRCHLIAYQLTGENNNKENLITCTRAMNTNGMLGFENKVADYIKETDNHVLYRVTPLYEGDNLLATGVQMEAYSIEDDGRGIKFNVFVYNIQDGININYKNGESSLN